MQKYRVSYTIYFHGLFFYFVSHCSWWSICSLSNTVIVFVIYRFNRKRTRYITHVSKALSSVWRSWACGWNTHLVSGAHNVKRYWGYRCSRFNAVKERVWNAAHSSLRWFHGDGLAASCHTWEVNIDAPYVVPGIYNNACSNEELNSTAYRHCHEITFGLSWLAILTVISH